MTAPFPDRLAPGQPYPLGASADGLGVNFAVFSAHATRVDLCIFDASGRKEIARLPLPECTDEVWHGYLPDAGAGLVYGYRVHGPYDPKRGHRFNPHKLVLDPYAKQLTGPLRWSDALFGYRMNHPREDLAMDRRDSAPAMPKAIVVEDAFNWGGSTRPRTPWESTFIYEAHVKGATMRREEIRPDLRGSFAALSNRHFIDHLVKIGVTAIELLPVHAFLQDRFLVERDLRNYWGYSTLSFFAPEPGYFSSNTINELRAAVRRLHAAGIEVILDVVYNHTCEGNHMGPTLSWRGLDNASYYRLVPGDERHYMDFTGCGNSVNLTHPRVLQMVTDSLRYWATAFQVDGFRFDLGVSLGREHDNFDPNSGFFDVIRQDPLLSQLKMISEPWDLGPDGYQVGNHPPGFAEWNDKFRDGVRKFWRGEEGHRGELAARLAGSGEVFNRRHRRPWSSVNFLAAHDGFTLQDVVSYNDKHNEANREENRDGHSANASNNWGVEGETDDAAILETRGRVKRSLLATLFFSYGTPMLLAGDEFGNSQGGNNNAYCQDNEISWLDWEAAASDAGQEQQDFVAQLTRLRREHPSLRATRYEDPNRQVGEGMNALAWFDFDAQPMDDARWNDHQGRLLVLRRAVNSEEGVLDVTAVLINGWHEALDFTLPPPGVGQRWRILLDTAQPRDLAARDSGPTLSVQARSVVLVHAVAGGAEET
ncbi:glycogen debranching protein GlgX [Achromobacter sp. GG226]|uniref:glycogen debranching protein GlgX n=1 Tax=Verticiella alkaliphila TaxID=2779529 RepID=UPI001C0CE6A8|nr:glycogen debranching protein GlgX [Verticiella sp. GG226]MBU4611827.1 glycogen debranching protein GlgX [Verticiella sp. GG226]